MKAWPSERINQAFTYPQSTMLIPTLKIDSRTIFNDVIYLSVQS